LQVALQEASEKNPTLIALRRQFDGTRFKPAEQRFLSPPMLETEIWQWPVNTLNPANANMYMFMATQEFPGRGKRALRAEAAEKASLVAEGDIAVRAQQILNDVRQQYAELSLTRRVIDVHLASAAVLRQVADISQAKYATGRISQQDVLKTVVELTRLHDDLIMIELQAELASARLNTLLDRAPNAPIGPLTELPERTLTASVEDLQRLAVDHQPELGRMRLEIERLQADLAVTRQDDKPDYSVQAGYMLAPNMTNAWLAKFGITWPRSPWSRGAVDARLGEANAKIEIAKAQLRMMENAVRLSVQEAYVRVRAAEERVALLRTTVLPQSRQMLEVSRIAFQGDRADSLGVVDSERGLLAAELDLSRSRSDLERATAELELAVGTDLPAAMLAAVNTGEVNR
jgi:outer membrane protein TolC